MAMKRREFISKSLAGLGAFAAGAGYAAAAEKQGIPTNGCDPYKQDVPLGKTGMKFSRLCQGTGMRGWDRASNHTRMGKEKFEALIQGAYERGVRVFDLADLYGTHPYVIPALKTIPRDKYKIVSKIWFRPNGLGDIKERPGADKVVERFLKEAQTDYLDMVLLHCVVDKNWNKDLREHMDLLAGLKKKGVIRAHGVSCHSIDALKTAAAEPWVDSVHTRINAYGAKMDGPVDEVVPVLKKIHDAGKGVIGMKILGEGTFRDSEEKKNGSIKYVLGLGCVDVLNVGFEKVSEIDDFAGRVSKVPEKSA